VPLQKLANAIVRICHGAAAFDPGVVAQYSHQFSVRNLLFLGFNIAEMIGAWGGWQTSCNSGHHQCVCALQSVLSAARPLLMAVAPAASIHVRAAAVLAMVAGLASALQPSARDMDADVLPWTAFSSMAYMV
jgi:hypothetical protein